MSGPLRVQVHAADLGGCGHYRLIWPSLGLSAMADPAELDVELLTPEHGNAEAFDCYPDLEATIARDPDAEQLIDAGLYPPELVELGGLNHIPDVDVVVLQRPLVDRLVDVIGFLQSAGVAVVVEVDDDFEHIHPANMAHATVDPRKSPRRNWRHLAAACELADLVVVTTEALAARYASHGRVAIIPNYVPTNYLHVIPRARDAGDTAVRVGWSGAVDTHPDDLQVTRGVVGSVLRERGLGFYLIGDGASQADRVRRNLGLRDDVPLAHTGGWLPLAQYPAGMALLDVGIVPLADTAFNAAKSWLKGLEFAALGVPFIASPTQPYRQLHDDHGLGLLASTPRDWRRLLARLVDDDDYRYELGREHRARARELTLDRHVYEWSTAWRQARTNADNRSTTERTPTS